MKRLALAASIALFLLLHAFGSALATEDSDWELIAERQLIDAHQRTSPG